MTLLFLLLLLPGAAAAAGRAATPVLIDQALAAGRIDGDEATVLRAQALNSDPALPDAYRSETPWEGTTTMLQVKEAIPDLPPAEQTEVRNDIVAPGTAGESCGSSNATLPNQLDTANFRVDFGSISGWTAQDYGTMLETARAKEVGDFGWPAPPTNGLYRVRIDDLQNGLMGFVTNGGTLGSGSYTDNPNTAWDDKTSLVTCMVLTSRMDQFGTGPLDKTVMLSSTVHHEYTHVLQFGLGVVGASDISLDNSLIEGGARWMEEEAQSENAAVTQGWPDLTLSVGEYSADPYKFWFVLRGLTERFGTGFANGGEQVMQDFYELLSKRSAGEIGALQKVMSARGTTLAVAYHDFAIGARFDKDCAGGAPAGVRCFAEASQYRAFSGYAPNTGAIATAGDAYNGSIRDDYAANYVALPAGDYPLTVANTAAGGALRATAMCDQLGALAELATFTVKTAGQSQRINGFSTTGCTSGTAVLVLTNGGITSTGNPASSTLRSYTVSTAPPVQRTLQRSATNEAGFSGSGSISVDQPGTACGTGCSMYEDGSTVTLTAVPDAGNRFSSWGGACTGSATTCTLTLSADTSVTARFQQLYTLTAAKGGAGSGTVTGAGIDCGSDCSETDIERTVTLTATPASGSRFAGWSDAGCDDTSTTCQVDVDADKTVTATFLLTRALTVARDGAGSGTVTGTGVDCGTDCAETYDDGTLVTLTATPASDSIFKGWTGACSGSSTCQVTMNQARSVNATFAQGQVVQASPQPHVSVTSDAGGVDCPATACSSSLREVGSTVALTAQLESVGTGRHITFTGWSGPGTAACDDSALTCAVTVVRQDAGATQLVTAGADTTSDLTTTVSGQGRITDDGTPARGIDCSGSCTREIPETETVDLVAVPAAGYHFVQWTGCATASGTTCTTDTMSQARTVAAVFVANPPRNLTVAKSGTGNGTVTGTGIACGNDCTQTVVDGTQVMLTAAPTTGSVFKGWSGGCAGTATTCTVTLDADKTVTAEFAVRRQLIIVKSGSGTVTGTGINCGIDCSEQVADGTTVTLTAAPAAGYHFAGWGGGICANTGATCAVTVDADKSIQATFESDSGGSGSGTPANTGMNTTTKPAGTTSNGTTGGVTPTTTTPTTIEQTPADAGATSGGGTPADTKAPVLRAVKLLSAPLGTVARSGLKLTVTPSEAARLAATLTADKATAKALGLKPKGTRTRVAKASVTSKAGTATTLAVKLPAGVAKKAAKLAKLKLRLTLVATDAAGNAATTTVSVSLKR